MKKSQAFTSALIAAMILGAVFGTIVLVTGLVAASSNKPVRGIDVV